MARKPLRATPTSGIAIPLDTALRNADDNFIELYDGGGGGEGAVASVNGQTGVVELDKSDIGLGSAENTSDADKPVSTAVATRLARSVGIVTIDAPSDGIADATAEIQAAMDAAALAGSACLIPGVPRGGGYRLTSPLVYPDGLAGLIGLARVLGDITLPAADQNFGMYGGSLLIGDGTFPAIIGNKYSGNTATGTVAGGSFTYVTTTLTSVTRAGAEIAHGLSVGNPVKFGGNAGDGSTLVTLPTGLTVTQVYYVVAVPSSTTFRISGTVGGAPISLSGGSAGTGPGFEWGYAKPLSSLLISGLGFKNFSMGLDFGARNCYSAGNAWLEHLYFQTIEGWCINLGNAALTHIQHVQMWDALRGIRYYADDCTASPGVSKVSHCYLRPRAVSTGTDYDQRYGYMCESLANQYDDLTFDKCMFFPSGNNAGALRDTIGFVFRGAGFGSGGATRTWQSQASNGKVINSRIDGQVTYSYWFENAPNFQVITEFCDPGPVNSLSPASWGTMANDEDSANGQRTENPFLIAARSSAGLTFSNQADFSAAIDGTSNEAQLFGPCDDAYAGELIRPESSAVTAVDTSGDTITVPGNDFSNTETLFIESTTGLANLPGGLAQVVTSIAGNTITLNSHGYQNWIAVKFESDGTYPTGIAAGQLYWASNAATNTFALRGWKYSPTVLTIGTSWTGNLRVVRISFYVRSLSAVVGTMQLAISSGGAAINLTSAGSGTLTVRRTHIFQNLWRGLVNRPALLGLSKQMVVNGLAIGTDKIQPLYDFISLVWPSISAIPCAPGDTYATDTTIVFNRSGSHLLSSATARTITLPAVSAMAMGAVIALNNIGTAAWTVARAGSDTINNAAANVVLAPGEWCLLLADNTPASGVADTDWHFYRGGRAKGTAQITTGNTSVTVTHALGYTPSRVHVTPRSPVLHGVSAVGATTFQIDTSPAAAGNIDFDWTAYP